MIELATECGFTKCEATTLLKVCFEALSKRNAIQGKLTFASFFDKVENDHIEKGAFLHENKVNFYMNF